MVRVKITLETLRREIWGIKEGKLNNNADRFMTVLKRWPKVIQRSCDVEYRRNPVAPLREKCH